MLTEHEKLNLDAKVGLLTNWWSEKGELDPELVWDLMFIPFCFVCSTPFHMGTMM